MSSTDQLWLYIQIGVAALVVLGFIIRAMCSGGGGSSSYSPPTQRQVKRYDRRAYKRAEAEIDATYYRVMRGLR